MNPFYPEIPALGAEAQAQARTQFRDYMDRIIGPRAGAFDSSQSLPREVIVDLGKQGYLGALVPSRFGGAGMNMTTLGLLHEETGRACSSVRSLLTVQSMVAAALLRCGSHQQQETWLPALASGSKIAVFGLTEAGAGSDAGAIETTATRRGAAYVLNGHKKWTTFAQIADLVLVFALCEGKRSAFLVESTRAGVTISPMQDLLGARASMLAEIRFDDVEIPAGNLIGSVGFGLAAVAGVALDVGRYSVACGCVGIAQACVDASVLYARQRRQFGSALLQHQLIARLIARMMTDVEAARLLCQRAGALKDEGDPATIQATLMAKYFASSAAMRAATDAVQIHGAQGCSQTYPVERLFRDAKIMEIIEGSTQLQEVMIAQHAFNNTGVSS